MKILVVGGAGYIGGVTARLAEEAGHKVLVADNLSSGKESNLTNAMVFKKGDITDTDFVASLFSNEQFDIVIHFAAKILVSESMQDPYSYLHTNSFGVLQVADAAARNGTKMYILSSTAATYGMPTTFPIAETIAPRPINPYGMSKLIAENILRSYELSHGLQWAALRYFNVAGAYKGVGPDYPFISHIIPMLLDKLRKNEPITIFGKDYATPDGTCVRDYVHVVDIARAHLLAAETAFSSTALNQPINLGSGIGFSVKEVVDKFQKVTGQAMRIQYDERRPGDPGKLVASNELAKGLLNWQPKLDLETTIHDHYQWYKSKQ